MIACNVSVKITLGLGCVLLRESVFEIKALRSVRAFQEVFEIYKRGLTTDRFEDYNIH